MGRLRDEGTERTVDVSALEEGLYLLYFAGQYQRVVVRH